MSYYFSLLCFEFLNICVYLWRGEPEASYMLDKCPITNLHMQSNDLV